MDSFTHLNYRYPGTPKAGLLYAHQQSPGHRQSIRDEAHLGNGFVRSNSGRMTLTGPSFNLTTKPGTYSQLRSMSVGARDATCSDPPGPVETYYMDESTGLSDHYIPSSNDKITCTDHCPLDEIFGNVRHSSSPLPAKSGSIPPSRNGTPRGHPRRSTITYALPPKPEIEGVVHIPLLAVDNHMNGTGAIIDFQCSDWGIGVKVEGIPMLDLLHGNVSGLENPHQCVLDGMGLIDLRFNILWPHYPPFVKVITAFGIHGKTLTRAELGYEVSLAFAEFFYQVTSQSIVSLQPGPYTISAMSSGSSTPGIRYDQLHLITVRNTSHSEWMAEIRAVSLP